MAPFATPARVFDAVFAPRAEFGRTSPVGQCEDEGGDGVNIAPPMGGAQSDSVARAGSKRRASASNPVHAAQAKIVAFAGGQGGARAIAEEKWKEF